MRRGKSSESACTPAPVILADLVARAQRGEEVAFAAIFESHKRRVYSLCLRITRSREDAEDITQEVFLKVFRKISTFRGDSAFSTWLCRLVINEALMHLRKNRVEHVSLTDSEGRQEGPARAEFGREDLQLSGTIDRINLNAALGKLSPGFRTAFVLHDVEGYEHGEIGRMMKRSVGNSKSQLHKARRKLRELLHPPFEAQSAPAH
ncbi:MAG TPA: RNA polymerase sigma factor [Terriglobia bacterium]|nr:RNA polymerase sigma factor [Terriglobia bacterium]